MILIYNVGDLCVKKKQGSCELNVVLGSELDEAIAQHVSM